MNKTPFSFLVLIILVIVPGLSITQDLTHAHHSTEELGEVHFPVSCQPSVQKDFDRAVALLHSFWYEEAEKAFTAITVKDPECGMGYWGMAMSNYHPIWAPPNPAELQRGKAASDSAQRVGAKTEREKSYIEAIAVFYQNSDTVDHITRAGAYEKAMERVYVQNQKDLEAAAFYSLSLLGTASASDKTYSVQKKAAAILNELVDQAPRHPGVAHYIIHSYDYPSLAEMALPAARKYSKIAPDSPHALHMPSHIFTRLGLWEESIQSNMASAASAKTHVEKTHPGAGSFDELHAMDYLTYAYLQLGQDQKARGIVEEASAIQSLDLNNFAAAYAFSAIPARFALERHDWTEAAALKVQPSWFPWDKFPYAEANIYFARAIGGARGEQIPIAREALGRLEALQIKLTETKDNYWANQVKIQALTASAWISLAEGKKDEALRQMTEAADMEGKSEKHPVTPGAIVPARELLAEMLLQVNQPALALTELEKSMQTAPNRLNAYAAAAHAARNEKNEAKAREYYEKLFVLTTSADSGRAEVIEAKTYLEK